MTERFASQQLILTVGPTCSGKSTWANEQVRANPTKYVNLNRDDFRFSLFGCRTWSDYKFNKHNEQLVTNAIQKAAIEAIAMSKTIIISDTNLNKTTQGTWKNFADTHNVEFVLKYFAPGLLSTLMERNRYKGERALPEFVVKRQYDQYMVDFGGQRVYTPDFAKPRAIIFDLDGTLFDNSQRHAFDWSKVLDDTPRDSVVELFKMYVDRGYACITVSGRDGVSEEDSIKALNNAGLFPAAHYQRAAGDSRSDDIVKEEIFWQQIEPNWCAVRAIDDRQKVVDMWRRIGLECWQVQPGDF